jgi:hypothetical protein
MREISKALHETAPNGESLGHNDFGLILFSYATLISMHVLCERLAIIYFQTQVNVPETRRSVQDCLSDGDKESFVKYGIVYGGKCLSDLFYIYN